MRIAMQGIEQLQAYVDTLIIIPNQNLFRVANDRTTFSQAFAMADDVLHSGVRGVTDLIVMPGLINLDFADIKTVMSEMGKAMMGTGEAEGEERALKAAEAAISNPLLDDVSMKGARGVLINITGGPDMMLFEVDQAANRVRAEVDPDANIIFGGTILENMEGRLRVSVVATGIEAEALAQMPKNVEPLRPRLKPVAVATASPMSPQLSPVHRQVEALNSSMSAPAAAPAQIAPVSAMEADILAGADQPIIGEDDVPPMPAITRAVQARSQPAPEPVEEKRYRFGFLGRRDKKPEARVEPQTVRTAIAPRASAQVMTRTPEPQRPAPQGNADDLFPDHKKDDQFEIPAFLRRQTN
jgi:cell division protein FtsZ